MSAKKVAVVSLDKNIADPSKYKFSHLYQAIGLNTGNFMFTNAVYRQIDADMQQVGFAFDPEQVNREYDALVIPAANWINAGSDFTFFNDLLEKIEIPVVPIGIGLQADSEDLSKVSVNESRRRLVKILSEKSKLISTRGEFTAAWLRSVGIENVVVTGCPSLYMKIFVDEPTTVAVDKPIIQSTRYYINKEFAQSLGVNSKLFKLAGELDLPMIYQSEAEEISYLVSGQFGENAEWDSKVEALATSYGFENKEQLLAYLNKNGNVFFDIEQWSSFVRQHSFVLGTRLHGAILALNSGVPACLVAHDSRTSEIAKFAGIPLCPDGFLDRVSSISDINRIKDELDVEVYFKKRSQNSKKYVDFLTASGLQANSSNLLA